MYLGQLPMPPGPFNINNYTADLQAMLDAFWSAMAGPLHPSVPCNQYSPEVGARTFYKGSWASGYPAAGMPDNSVMWNQHGVSVLAPATSMAEANARVGELIRQLRRLYTAQGGSTRTLALCSGAQAPGAPIAPAPSTPAPSPSAPASTPTLPPDPVLYGGAPPSSKPAAGQGALRFAPTGTGAPTTRERLPVELGTTYEVEPKLGAGAIAAGGALLLLLAGRRKK